MNADDVFERLCELAGVKSDAALAGELSVSPQAIANSRKRASVPYEKICAYAEEHGHSLDYIMLGKEDKSSGGATDPLKQLKSWAQTVHMAELLHFIFHELDKELFLREQISEKEPFWLVANVYQEVLSHLPDGSLADSEEKAYELAKHFSKEEVERYNRMLAIARRNTERREPSKPARDTRDGTSNSEISNSERSSSAAPKEGVRQEIGGKGHQIAGGNIENKGGVSFGGGSKK